MTHRILGFVVLHVRPSLPLLVVEDHEETRTALVRLLHLEGYTVVSAPDGQAALDFFRQGGRAAMIVMDLQMPRLDGWLLRSRLLEDPELARIPVVVFSAHPAADLPAVTYANKSDPGALLDVLDRQSRSAPLIAR
jgi:CheY-like chemotaxis protein